MKSDDQTNIDKYRISASITEYHIIINLPKNHNVKMYVKISKTNEFEIDRTII